MVKNTHFFSFLPCSWTMVKNSAIFYLPLTFEGPIDNGKKEVQSVCEPLYFARLAKHSPYPVSRTNAGSLEGSISVTGFRRVSKCVRCARCVSAASIASASVMLLSLTKRRCSSCEQRNETWGAYSREDVVPVENRKIREEHIKRKDVFPVENGKIREEHI